MFSYYLAINPLERKLLMVWIFILFIVISPGHKEVYLAHNKLLINECKYSLELLEEGVLTFQVSKEF